MICLTFVHFEPDIKTEMHKRLNRYLKIDGIIELNKEFVSLNEGFGHVGESSVIRFIGRKVTE